MILAYSSYSNLAYDVTTGHMILRFEVFFRETGKRQTGKFGQGIYTIVQNLVTLQHVC